MTLSISDLDGARFVLSASRMERSGTHPVSVHPVSGPTGVDWFFFFAFVFIRSKNVWRLCTLKTIVLYWIFFDYVGE